MGFSFLSAGAGAAAGLEDLLTRQRLDEQQRLANDARVATGLEQHRSNVAQENYRNEALGENVKLRQQLQANQLANWERDDKRLENEQVLKHIDLRPIGSQVPLDEQTRELQAGVPQGYYGTERSFGPPLSGDAQGPAMPTVPALGTEKQQLDRLKEANDKAQAEGAAADRALAFTSLDESRKANAAHQRAMEEIARQNAGTQGANRDRTDTIHNVTIPPGIPGYEQLAGQTGTIMVDKQTNKPVAAYPVGETAAMRTAAGKANRTDSEDIIDIDTVIRQGDELEKKGITATGALGQGWWEQKKSEVLGPGGTALGGMVQAQPEEASIFRTGMNTIRTRTAHDYFGSAFTGNENSMLNGFAAGTSMNWKEARARLLVAKSMKEARMAARSKGRTTPQVTPEMLEGLKQQAMQGQGIQIPEIDAAPTTRTPPLRDPNGGPPQMPGNTLPVTSSPAAPAGPRGQRFVYDPATGQISPK